MVEKEKVNNDATWVLAHLYRGMGFSLGDLENLLAKWEVGCCQPLCEDEKLLRRKARESLREVIEVCSLLWTGEIIDSV